MLVNFEKVWFRLPIISALLLGFLFGNPAFAQFDFSQWINPGPLSKPHESLEGVRNCTQCHATARGVPDRKCLECHNEIQERLAARKGYHARVTEQCLVCHSEHKGKNYDVTGLSRLPFDHADTGWSLTGAHKTVDCKKCHTQKRRHTKTGRKINRTTYLEAKTACISCHADPHKSKKPSFERCEKCHTTVTWEKLKRRLRFNHNRETVFRLTGAHKKVDCYDCHKKKIWAPVAHKQCTACHVDPHKGRFGKKCEDCHNTFNWKRVRAGKKLKPTFDHNKTRFPLRGKHRFVTCKRCHGPVIGKMKNFKQCSGCHNNPHGDQFQKYWNKKKVCSDCHLTKGWRVLSFRHNRDSRYDLVDKHKAVPCNQCHTKGIYRWLTQTPSCDTCHVDVHKKQFTKPCAACHTQKGFRVLKFDHNRDSPFPLVGKHKYVKCEYCHPNGRYRPLERNCSGCHNDFHRGALGNECRRCHSPIAFNDIDFDHNREARFPLRGKHTENQCNQCHINYQYKLPSYECASCHLDIHKGSFGQACERCHTTSGFSVRPGFHDFGEFSLGGAHDRVDCLTCHGPKAAIRTEPTQCASCHKDPHMNSFGNRCYTCHGQYAWLPSKFRHNQTGFELSGAHRFLSCDRCHFNRVLGGLPQECTFCHIKDFRDPSVFPPHQNAVGLPCDTCHLTFGWRPTR